MDSVMAVLLLELVNKKGEKKSIPHIYIVRRTPYSVLRTEYCADYLSSFAASPPLRTDLRQQNVFGISFYLCGMFHICRV